MSNLLFSPSRLVSYSQLGEDVYCLQNFMNIPRSDAILFEVGAYNGLTYSNTFALEDVNKCKCVLVEPSPVNVRQVYLNRPNASVHGLAIMESFGAYEFLGDSPLSGVASELTEDYRTTWQLDLSRRYNVLGAPLSIIMDIEKVSYIDFLSIDVQGAELSVLNSTNWRIPIGVICIELEGQNPDNDERCRRLLRDKGFRYKCRLHISEFWYNERYARSDLLFDPKKKAYRLDQFECRFFNETWQSMLREHFY